MYTENCTKKSFFITKIRLDTVPRTILCSLDVRLTHKNIIILVASKVKELSGGRLMWDMIISSGQMLSLQVMYYCALRSIRKGIVVCFNPPIRGETLPQPSRSRRAYI